MMLPLSEKVISHRGASAYAPENTFAAFNKALAMGSHQIEFDVVLSADGVPFVFHDEYLNRTTNGSGAIGMVTAEYLSSLDAGSWFSKTYLNEKIPLFRDVIDWLMTHSVHANIEIKPFPGKTEETTRAVLETIRERWKVPHGWPLLSSFDLEALQLCIQLEPEMPRGYLLHRWDKDWFKKAVTLECSAMHINHKILTPKRVASIKAAGYSLLAYTVNNASRAQTLFDWGVNAVFSDYPDILE